MTFLSVVPVVRTSFLFYVLCACDFFGQYEGIVHKEWGPCVIPVDASSDELVFLKGLRPSAVIQSHRKM